MSKMFPEPFPKIGVAATTRPCNDHYEFIVKGEDLRIKTSKHVIRNDNTFNLYSQVGPIRLNFNQTNVNTSGNVKIKSKNVLLLWHPLNKTVQLKVDLADNLKDILPVFKVTKCKIQVGNISQMINCQCAMKANINNDSTFKIECNMRETSPIIKLDVLTPRHNISLQGTQYKLYSMYEFNHKNLYFQANSALYEKQLVKFGMVFKLDTQKYISLLIPEYLHKTIDLRIERKAQEIKGIYVQPSLAVRLSKMEMEGKPAIKSDLSFGSIFRKDEYKGHFQIGSDLIARCSFKVPFSNNFIIKAGVRINPNTPLKRVFVFSGFLKLKV